MSDSPGATLSAQDIAAADFPARKTFSPQYFQRVGLILNVELLNPKNA